ncbi:argininosuccinate lyase [Micromonospora endophytica]|uniref:Argininosuccinate lyase n=1 Tax=Micromonospora endophytica TaxID=515350 RepID=A0A2W2C8W2_9ACTN|nr:argininosuccinate lyase [Micromonospora endophytica]PZF95835.1 argininosuccinate lyase [Micromonospora endophytica]RIW41536.1 argininosuccinate lyase [Micromonospora endophytica]BCJ61422.1 argininosuccinate lyase [Micromonospora endophytica]
MTQKLWGGRFSEDITSEVLEYTLTVDVDVRLLPHDLWQNVAHVLLLAQQGIINMDAARSLLNRLGELDREREAGALTLRPEYEDVHLNLEQMVIEKLGLDVGGRMHTARSRNDQVSTDARLYLREVLLSAMTANLDLIDLLAEVSDDDLTTVLPGYTHSQAAQPVSVAFWRTAHASALSRDVRRLRDAFDRVNESPLGACALAGTSFNLDRDATARLLGFDRVLTHALDATSARDHMIEAAAVFALGGNNLSRMAEEIVMWSGHEYRLCEVGDAFSTGSSIMPQKKNPVVAELVRGRSGRTVGVLMQLLTAVKGVTLGYSCDLQEDKPFLWQSIDTYLSALRIVEAQTRTLRFDPGRGEELCWVNFSTATELANYLVAEAGVSFRESHHVVGRVVGQLLARQATLRDLDLVAELVAAEGYPVAEPVLRDILAPRNAVNGYTSAGGTAATSVRRTAAELRERSAEQRAWVDERQADLTAARAATFRCAEEVAAGVALDKALPAALCAVTDKESR